MIMPNPDEYKYLNRKESGTVYGTGNTPKSFNDKVRDNFKKVEELILDLQARVTTLENQRKSK